MCTLSHGWWNKLCWFSTVEGVDVFSLLSSGPKENINDAEEDLKDTAQPLLHTRFHTVPLFSVAFQASFMIPICQHIKVHEKKCILWLTFVIRKLLRSTCNTYMAFSLLPRSWKSYLPQLDSSKDHCSEWWQLVMPAEDKGDLQKNPNRCTS